MNQLEFATSSAPELLRNANDLCPNFASIYFSGIERRGSHYTEQRCCRFGIFLDGRGAVSCAVLFAEGFTRWCLNVLMSFSEE